LLDDTTVAVCAVEAVAFGCLGVWAATRGHTALGAVLGVIAVPGGLVVVVRLLMEAASELLGYLVLALFVVMLPLLLVPGVRRWTARRREPGATGEVHPGDIPGAYLHRDGDEVTVTVLGPGESTTYRGSGRSGRELERGFRVLLGERLTTH
jgi:hypothetical protein